MTVPTFAYTLSSRRGLVQEALQSIKTLQNWVSSEQIVVFYTPPRQADHRHLFAELGVDVREVENATSAFSMQSGEPASNYGEKFRIGTLDASTVVFLDCDTLILDDPKPFIEGDFEFKARPGSYDIDSDEWQALFDRYGEKYHDWMPNAGVMIFKNGLHRKIQSDWKKYILEEIELPSAHIRHGEQYALALAISGYNTKRMSPTEHVMCWRDELPANGIVYHGDYPSEDRGTFRKNLRRMLESLLDRRF